MTTTMGASYPDRAALLRRLRAVRDRIDRDYAQPLDVEELAAGAHLSARHLTREFTKAYDETPYGYLMTRRVERAMALLRETDRSVTDICLLVGASSLGSFTTRFGELVGMTPTQYRERARRNLAGLTPCLARTVTKPVRNREVPPPLAP